MAGLTPTSSSTPRRVLAWLPIIALAVFIVAPQVAMVAYAMFSNGEFTVSAFAGLIGNNAFYNALTLSLVISLATVVLLVVVLVPAVVAVHLWAPKLSGLLSILCTLPLVIPAIALVAGLLQILRTMASTGRGSPLNVLSASLQNSDFPIALIGTYVVLSLPFTYRSVNAALGTIRYAYISKPLPASAPEPGRHWPASFFRIFAVPYCFRHSLPSHSAFRNTPSPPRCQCGPYQYT